MSDAANRSFWQEIKHVWNAQTAMLFLASLLTPAAAFTLYPFLTIYFTHRLGLTVAMASVLLSVRFLSSAFLGFVGGLASDRFGLLPTYGVAGVVTAIAVFWLAFGQGTWLYVLLLVVLGVSASAVNAMVRGLASVSVTAESRGFVQNIVHWLNNVGMAAALPISAFFLRGGTSRLPFVVTAAAYLLLALLLPLMLRRAPGLQKATRKGKTPKAKASLPWRLLAADRAFAYLMAAFVLWGAVEFQFESSVPLDLSYHFSAGAKLYGTLGVLDMVVVMALQPVVSHWLSKRTSPLPGYLGFIMLGGLVVGGLWQTVPGWIIAIVLLAVGEVLSLGQIMNLMGVLPKEGQQGSYFALFGMAQGLATFLAYSFGGLAYQQLHAAGLFVLCVPLAVLAAVLYRCAIVSQKQQSIQPQTSASGG